MKDIPVSCVSHECLLYPKKQIELRKIRPTGNIVSDGLDACQPIGLCVQFVLRIEFYIFLACVIYFMHYLDLKWLSKPAGIAHGS